MRATGQTTWGRRPLRHSFTAVRRPGPAPVRGPRSRPPAVVAPRAEAPAPAGSVSSVSGRRGQVLAPGRLERATVLRAVRLVLTLALTAAAALALVVVRAPSAEALPPPCNVPPPPTRITTATTVSAPNITFPGPATVSATVAGAEGHGTVTIAVDGIQVAAAAPNPTVQATLGALNVGPHTVQASYSGFNAEPPPLACGGGTFFTPSSGSGVFTVQPQSVRTTMTVDALSADATQPVKLVAHVGSAPVANAGSVSFLMAGHQQVVPL